MSVRPVAFVQNRKLVNGSDFLREGSIWASRFETGEAGTKGVLQAVGYEQGTGAVDVAASASSMMVVDVMGSSPPVGES